VSASRDASGAPLAPTEREWEYEVWVGTVRGTVRAADEDAAMQAADDDIAGRLHEIIGGATWSLRETES
jgi:hypothetical protein